MSETTQKLDIIDNFKDREKRISSAVPNAAMRAILVGTPEAALRDNQSIRALAAYLRDENVGLSPEEVDDFDFADKHDKQIALLAKYTLAKAVTPEELGRGLPKAKYVDDQGVRYYAWSEGDGEGGEYYVEVGKEAADEFLEVYKGIYNKEYGDYLERNQQTGNF